jgi:hypothetical protein
VFEKSVRYLVGKLAELSFFIMPTRTTEYASMIHIQDMSLAELREEADRLGIEIGSVDGHKGHASTWAEAIREHRQVNGGSGASEDPELIECYSNEVEIDASENADEDEPIWVPLNSLPNENFQIKEHLRSLACKEAVSRPVASAPYHAACAILISKLPIKDLDGHNDTLRRIPVARIDCVLSAVVDNKLPGILRAAYCRLLRSMYIPAATEQNRSISWCHPPVHGEFRTPFAVDPLLTLDTVLVALRQSEPLGRKSNVADTEFQIWLVRSIVSLVLVTRFSAKQLQLVEHTVFDLLRHLHATFAGDLQAGFAVPSHVQELLIEIVMCFDRLYDYCTNLLVAEFADNFDSMTQTEAESILPGLQMAWVSQPDPVLRAMLLDMLVVENGVLSGHIFVVLEKMHSRQTQLLKAAKSTVFIGADKELESVITDTIAGVTRLRVLIGKSNPETAGHQLEKAFHAMDADGSGVLERDEIRALVEMTGSSFTEEELNNAIGELDSDYGGTVDFAEFKAYWESNIIEGGNLLKGMIAREAQEIVTELLSLQAAKPDFGKIAHHAGLPHLSKELLRCFKQNLDDSDLAKQCLTDTFTLLKQLCEYEDNKAIMLPLLNTVMFGGDSNEVRTTPFMGMQCGETFLIQEILRNNRDVLRDMSDDFMQEVARLASMHCKYKGCRYVDTLYISVFCQGSPIAANQDRILRALNASKSMDEEYWCLIDASLGSERRRPNLESLCDAAADLDDPFSRATYHTKMIHLLAACCEGSNEITSRKLRNVVPLDFAADIIAEDEVPPQIRNAYLRIFDALYVTPIEFQPSLAFDFYINHMEKPPSLNPATSDSLRRVVRASLSLILDLNDNDNNGDTEAVLTVYKPTDTSLPKFGYSCGAAVFMRSLFQAGLFESLEETLRGGNTRIFYQSCLPGTEEGVCAALLKLIEMPDLLRPMRQTVSGVIAALNYSGYFDAGDQKIWLHDSTSIMQAVRELRKQLSLETEGIRQMTTIDTIEKMAECAKMAWGNDDTVPEWVKKECTEANWWSVNNSLLPDRFQLRKFYAEQFLNSCGDQEQSEPPKEHSPFSMFHFHRTRTVDDDSIENEATLFTMLTPEATKGRSKAFQRADWQRKISNQLLNCTTKGNGIQHAEPNLAANAELIFAGLNGALMMSHVDEDSDSGSDSVSSDAASESSLADSADSNAAVEVVEIADNDINPSENVQNALASMGVHHLVATYLRPEVPDVVCFRATRLGIMLLQGGNVEVQDCFRQLQEDDKSRHMKSSLLENLRQRLRGCMLSPEPPTALRYLAGTRLLRFMQLLCEGKRARVARVRHY